MLVYRHNLQRRAQTGLTLVELLVVLAIISALAGIIYPAIINSIQKSEAAIAAQRIDALEKAKLQYRLDHQDDTTPVSNATFDLFKGYLVRFGQSVTTQDQLNEGTGGTVEPGDLLNCAYFAPNDKSASFAALLKKYNVPLIAQPEADPLSETTATGASGTP